MTGNMLRWELNAFVGFIERQKNLYRRYWAWEAVWLLYNLVSVLSIGYLAAGLSTLGLEQGQANLHQTQLYLLVGALLWVGLLPSGPKLRCSPSFTAVLALSPCVRGHACRARSRPRRTGDPP